MRITNTTFLLIGKLCYFKWGVTREGVGILSGLLQQTSESIPTELYFNVLATNRPNVYRPHMSEDSPSGPFCSVKYIEEVEFSDLPLFLWMPYRSQLFADILSNGEYNGAVA